MNWFKRNLFTVFAATILCLSIKYAIAQTSAVTGPVVISQTPPGLIFAKAYYAAQNPLKAPLYNQRYGGGTGAMLTAAQLSTLISQLMAANVSFDEQIDDWGWDPLTVMTQRQMMGIPWVPSGQGATVCLTIAQPGCVITAGLFSGAAPAGAIMTSTALSAYPPWPVSAPVTVVPTAVGPEITGPYYEVIGAVPPLGTVSGKCLRTTIPNLSMFGDGTLMNVWQCSN